MATFDVPHLAFPPRTTTLANGDVVYAAVEQDSAEHIADRVELAIRTPQGSRIEDPAFGVPVDVLRTPGVDLPEFRRTLSESEPAASVVVDRVTEPDDVNVDRLRILILEEYS